MTLKEAWYWLAMTSGLSVRYLSFESFCAWQCKFLNCGIAYLFHIHKVYMYLKNVHPFSCFEYSVFTWIECEKFFIHHFLQNCKIGSFLIDTHKAKHLPCRYFTENWRFWLKGNHIQVCMVCQQYAVHIEEKNKPTKCTN